MEGRSLLSITIQLNYSLDSSNFFNTQAKRDVLQAAADAVAGSLNDNLLAIQPSGSNTWSAQFPNPTTGQQTSVNNPVILANTLIVYVGGRSLPGQSEAGEGSTGGFNASGDQAWLNLVGARGQSGALSVQPTDYGPWGGSISFDNSGATNWFFGLDPSGITSAQTDFYSVAQHELGHVLGIGTAASWATDVSGGVFVGAASEAAHGGQPVPLNPSADHWAQGTTSDGSEVLMEPSLLNGQRRSFTRLDFAGLADVGWQVQPTVLQSVFRFSQPLYRAPARAGSVLVTVIRSGSTGAGSVQYATGGGTAEPNVDYVPTSGTLNFAAGQTTQTFSITLLNDPTPDATQSINVALSSTGASSVLGNPSTTAVSLVAQGNHPNNDYDAVGYSELSVFRPATASWLINGPQGNRSFNYGATNLFDIPVPGDYDGIGRTEKAIFRPSTGQWIITNPISNTTRTVSFGARNLFDIPVPGDYDGVGRTEVAVFRPSTGQWLIQNPNTGQSRAASFGARNLFDIPVPGDYDGVGRTEFAVFRPSTAQWLIQNPNTGQGRSVSFGARNLFDIPVPGDYDGLGRTEVAIFRPSTAQWFIQNPANPGQPPVTFGATSLADIPLAAPIGSLKKLGVVPSRSTAVASSTSTAGAVGASAAVTTFTGTPATTQAGAGARATAADLVVLPPPVRKPPAQASSRSAWLAALEALAGERSA